MNAEKNQAIPLDELLRKFSCGKGGLTSDEVQRRLAQYGPNEIPEKRKSPALQFLAYFWGPIPWMIEIAAVLSAVIRHWEDFYVIFAMLLVNAVVGFLQEHKADNAIELLKQRLAPKARVLRDGKWAELASRDLVPGDVLRVRLGDIVPADLALMDGDYLSIDESALTGESLPVEKHAEETAYASSIVRQGEMDGLVTATGKDTFFGKTTTLVEEARTPSHFQKAVVKIGDYLIVLAIALVAIVFMTALFRHESFLETLQFALVLIVAAIPVALPAVLTVTLAVGASVLARKEAIVSRLVSIEEMAGMDILCSDKTGTITKNELVVDKVDPCPGVAGDDVLLFGMLASKEEDRDPIDNAIILKGRASAPVAEKAARYTTVNFRPFDPVSKRTEAAVAGGGTRFTVTKGAPQVILALAGDAAALGPWVEKEVAAFAHEGFRALGVAAKAEGQDAWAFKGLLALYDSPREDSAATIRAARAMGVDVKMVTGDHVAVAQEIAREVGLGSDILPADAIIAASDARAQRLVEEADGFAQVFPEHKYHIVEELQHRGHIVGMTGDGVNDAPALKKADAGIAVAGATDAAKSAAAIVLTKPGLSVIIDAMRESRKIFQRMNNYAVYRIAETIRVLFFLTLSILVFNFYPVTAVMIVILAMLNDLPIMMIAYDNAKVLPRPVRWDMGRVLTLAGILGLLGVSESFFIFWIGKEVLVLKEPVLQTFIFLKLAVAGHMTIYMTRTGERPFWTRPYPAAALFVTAEATQAAATLFAVYGVFMHPIGWRLALFVWGYALVFFVIIDSLKVAFLKVADHRNLVFRARNRLQRKALAVAKAES